MAESLTKIVTDTVFDLCDEILNELIADHRKDDLMSSMGESGQIHAVIRALETARSRIKDAKDRIK